MDVLANALDAYPLLIEFLLYFFVFGSAARVGFAKTFPNSEGKTLAVAVGVFLAVALTVAERKLGFSIENMGPVAAFILSVVIFIMAYKFLQLADTPKPLAILISAMLVIALLRATMPGMTSRFIQQNPLSVVLVLAALMIWMWQSTSSYARKIDIRKPGQTLARSHVVPDDTTLRREKKFVKKGMRKVTRQDRREENAAGREMTHTLEIVEKEGVTGQNRSRLLALTDKVLKRAQSVQDHTRKLIRLDDALKRFDLKWFHRTHSFNLASLTPAQQRVMQENIVEERRRVRSEEEIEKLEIETDLHVRTMQEHVKKCRDCLTQGNAAGASGWLAEALQEQKRSKELEDKIMAWEQRLLKLIKREKKELDAPA